MSYYNYHVFFCTNQCIDSQCCSTYGTENAKDYMKKRCKALGIHGPGKVRVNTAGCFDRCAQGPVIVIYPEAVWYTWVDSEDLDEIIDSHLIAGKWVDRLRLPEGG